MRNVYCRAHAFPGKIIPASRIDPTGAKILAFPEYALPNTAGQAFTNNLQLRTMRPLAGTTISSMFVATTS